MSRAGDAPVGAVFLVLALAVLWHVSDYPPAPGQPYGPALFPGLIAVGLAVCSALLMFAPSRARGGGLRGLSKTGQGADSLVARVDSGASPGPGWIPFVMTVGALVGYVAVVDRLGFLPTAVLMLAALFRSYGVGTGRTVILAVIASLAVHTAFYKVLKVPLPWGVLSGMAW